MSYAKPSTAHPPVPDRTRTPDIGAACHDTRKVAPAVKVGEPSTTRIGPTESGLDAKQSAYDRARRGGG